MALSCLDPNGEEFIQEQSIADKTGISKPYLSKLIHKLSQGNLERQAGLQRRNHIRLGREKHHDDGCC